MKLQVSNSRCPALTHHRTSPAACETRGTPRRCPQLARTHASARGVQPAAPPAAPAAAPPPPPAPCSPRAYVPMVRPSCSRAPAAPSHAAPRLARPLNGRQPLLLLPRRPQQRPPPPLRPARALSSPARDSHVGSNRANAPGSLVGGRVRREARKAGVGRFAILVLIARLRRKHSSALRAPISQEIRVRRVWLPAHKTG